MLGDRSRSTSRSDQGGTDDPVACEALLVDTCHKEGSLLINRVRGDSPREVREWGENLQPVPFVCEVVGGKVVLEEMNDCFVGVGGKSDSLNGWPIWHADGD